MSRDQRAAYAPAFAEAGDFNEQLYKALRGRPWWMISIAVHVLLVVMSSMMQTDGAVTPAPAPVQIGSMGPADAPPDELKPPEADDTDQVHLEDVHAKEPTIKDAEPSDHNETDNDMPYEESFGGGGLSDAPFEGPANNGLIGIGGSSGGAFKGRGGHRNLRVGNRGGTKTEDALDHALRWLAAHQSPEGGWEAEGFGRWCDGKPAAGPGPDGKGKAQYDVGVTGLALLAFLGAGYTNRSEGPFGKVVANGLRWLKSVQDAEGCFGHRATGHFVYNHATAALAMVEAYGMTGSAIYRGPAQKALDFIAVSRNAYAAWRYGVKPGNNDTSVTGWMMMALKSAKLIDAADVKGGKPPSLMIDEDAFEGIKTWIDRMTDPESGRVGYDVRGTGPARPTELVDRFPQEKSESMTAVGVLARVFLGENPKTSKAIQDGAALCAKALPTWNPNDGSIDMYYWYYGTLAVYQVGGEPWKKWDAAIRTAMVDRQRLDGDYCMYKGSWDPLDPWADDGGRVYSTAVLAMCLEVYYRYPQVAGAKVEEK